MATDGDRRHPDAFLITNAPESYEEQHRARVRRYLGMMAFRVPALLLAALAYVVTDSGLLALAIIALSIPLPWVAVLVANDRPPRKRSERPTYKYGSDRDLFGPQGLSATGRALAAPRNGGDNFSGAPDFSPATDFSGTPEANRVADPDHVIVEESIEPGESRGGNARGSESRDGESHRG